MKVIKRILLIGLILAFFILGVIYRGRHHIAMGGYEVEKMENLIVDNYQSIKAVNVELDLADFEIIQGDQAYLEVVYPVYKDDEVKILIENFTDKLEIKSQLKNNSFNFNKPNISDTKITLILPRDYTLEKLDTKLDLGNMNINQMTATESVIELALGNLVVNHSILGKLDANLSMGSFEINEMEITDGSQLDLNMGSIVGSLKVKEGTTDINVDMGSVELEMFGGDYYFEVNTDMGEARINSSYREGKEYNNDGSLIKINVDMGDIEIN